MAKKIMQNLFSLLSESLIITILSLLPLQDAICTSILAKKWHDLWRFRPNIEINERQFIPFVNKNNHEQNQTDSNQTTQSLCFDFGRRWLQFLSTNNPFISSFTIVFSNPMAYHEDIETFIRFAIDHGTKSLKLDFSSLHWDTMLPLFDTQNYLEHFALPQFVYQYQELETLDLVSCSFRNGVLANLGCALKNVSLSWIEIVDVSTLRNLMRSCPLIESLRLSKCFGSTIYVIESLSLKSLVVEECVDVLHLTIIASNLRSFKYYGDTIEVAMCYYRSLEEVDIDFGLANFFDLENADEILPILSWVHFVKSLKICSYITQVLPLVVESSKLHGRARVKELTIKTTFHAYEFPGILCLLNSYPLLEKLFFQIGQRTIFQEEMEPYVNWDAETYWSDTTAFEENGCIKKKLKYIEIEGYQGNSYELKVLFCLLFHATALRTIVLRMAQECNEQVKGDTMMLRTLIMKYYNHVNVIVIT